MGGKAGASSTKFRCEEAAAAWRGHGSAVPLHRGLTQKGRLLVSGGDYLARGGFGFAAQSGHGGVVGWEEVPYDDAHGAGG